MEPRRPWLIVNPTAGRKGGFVLNAAGPAEARAALERHGVHPELCVTERADHATLYARQAVAAGADLVVAAGGDGTIHEIARALVNTGTALAILPLGSMMNLARALEVPRDLDGAAALIRDGRVIGMDVGRATTASTETYFLEAAGVGLDAGLFAYGNQLDVRKWRYVMPLLRFVGRYRAGPARLVVDGRLVHVPRALMISVAVAPFIGLALSLAPEAKLDDRQFDVVVRQAGSRAELLHHAVTIALGLRRLDATTETLRGRAVEVETLDRPTFVHADSHLIGRTPVRFEIVPAAIPVVAGFPAATAASPIAPRDSAA